jgi:hypothetical protein
MHQYIHPRQRECVLRFKNTLQGGNVFDIDERHVVYHSSLIKTSLW